MPVQFDQNSLRQVTVKIGDLKKDGYQGTGFFLLSDVVICCYHSIERLMPADYSAGVRLDSVVKVSLYQRGSSAVANGEIFIGNPVQDFALIRVKPEELQKFKVMKFHDGNLKIERMDLLHFYGYPNSSSGGKYFTAAYITEDNTALESDCCQMQIAKEDTSNLTGASGSPVVYGGSGAVCGFLIQQRISEPEKAWFRPFTEDLLNLINTYEQEFISKVEFASIPGKASKEALGGVPVPIAISQTNTIKPERRIKSNCEKLIGKCLCLPYDAQKLDMLIRAVVGFLSNPLKDSVKLNGETFSRDEFKDALANALTGNRLQDWFVKKDKGHLESLVSWVREDIKSSNEASMLLLLYFQLLYLYEKTKEPELGKIVRFMGKAVKERFNIPIEPGWSKHAFSILRMLDDYRKDKEPDLEAPVLLFVMVCGNLQWIMDEECFQSYNWVLTWSDSTHLSRLQNFCAVYHNLKNPKSRAIKQAYNIDPIKDLEDSQTMFYQEVEEVHLGLSPLYKTFNTFTKPPFITSWKAGQAFFHGITLLFCDMHRHAYKAAFYYE